MKKGNSYWFVGIGILAFFILVPHIMPRFQLRMLTEIIIFTLFTLTWKMMLNEGGMFSFGHAAYFGFGAYASVLGWMHIQGLSFLGGVLLGGLAAALLAFLLSAFLVRLSGTYYALLTFAFNMLVWGLIWKWRSVTGGDDGLGMFPKPDLLGISMKIPANFYYATLVIIGLCMFICWYLIKTPFGNTVMSIKANEERAKFIGVQVRASKLLFLTQLGFFAGVSGALFAQFHEFICPTVIDMGRSTNVLFMAYIGGVGHFWGPLLGSGLFVYLSEYLSSLTARWEFFMGLIFVTIAVFAPQGIAGIIKKKG
jgi:branched-chain amino acid transport system permease protein